MEGGLWARMAMERLRMVDWWTCRSRHHASSSAGTVDLNNGAAGLHEPGLRRLALEGNGHAYRLATAIDAPTNARTSRAVSAIRIRKAMAGMAWTTVLPEAAPLGPLSAQLRQPRPRSATGALRRLLPAGMRRVGVWRGGVRLGISVPAPFVWRCLSGSAVAPFHTPSSNRTGRFPASGSRTRPHAFVHGTSRPSRLRRTSPKCP